MAVMKIFFNKKITMKIFIFLLIILLGLLIYKVTIGVPKIETIKELDQLINIDLSNDMIVFMIFIQKQSIMKLKL